MWPDATGALHARAEPGARIVSLVPSLTELLFELGLASQIVGRTGFCVHPHQAVAQLPKVGGTKDVRLDALRTLAPTHVIVNVDENEAPTVETIRGFVPHVIVTHPNAPQDNAALFELFGRIFGAETSARALTDELQREIDACAASAWEPERVLYLIWKDPWMTIAADTYIGRTLAMVGWQVPHGEGGWAGAARYPVIKDLDAAIAGVDRLLLSSEPFMFRATHLDEMRTRFSATPIELIDGEMTSWYGPRAIRGLRYLRGLRTLRSGAAQPLEA
jgi:ABC-type Fe3+-hydroxamate transport system substrate-binding protein